MSEDVQGLSLSITRDPLAISELLDDSTRERRRLQRNMYDLMQALADVLGDDVWRVDAAGLPALVREEAVATSRRDAQVREAFDQGWDTASWHYARLTPDEACSSEREKMWLATRQPKEPA